MGILQRCPGFLPTPSAPKCVRENQLGRGGSQGPWPGPRRDRGVGKKARTVRTHALAWPWTAAWLRKGQEGGHSSSPGSLYSAVEFSCESLDAQVTPRKERAPGQRGEQLGNHVQIRKIPVKGLVGAARDACELGARPAPSHSGLLGVRERKPW